MIKLSTKSQNKYFLIIGITLLIVSLSSFSSLAQTETYKWDNIKIGGGGFVSGIITSKTEQNLVYARTDVGGAYRWDAANNKWVSLLDWVSENELGYLGVESIAIDPKEPNKVYMLVGTSYFNSGKTAILKSSDYGNTFSISDVTHLFKAHGNGMGRQTGEKLMVDPNSTDIVFCGTRSNGLFKSINSGGTWNRVTGLNVTTTPNQNGISFILFDPSSGTADSATKTLIAGVSRSEKNLYISNDGGDNFEEIAGAPEGLMPHRAVLSSDKNLYITYANAAGPWDITGAGQIWKYNLATKTWTNVTPSNFTGAFGGISIDPSNPARLVASSINTYKAQGNSWGDRIFLTIDAGATWTDVIERSFDLDQNGISWIEGHAIHWAGSIEFDPSDTKKVWVSSGNGIFKTDDIDASTSVWKFEVNGLEETVPLDLVSIPNGPVISVIGDYDGFLHTDISEYGPIHTPRTGTTTGLAYASINPDVVLRVGEKMFYSLDMGLTWTESTPKGPKGNVAISADGKVFLHCPEGSTITYRSTDRGATWSAVSGLDLTNARPVSDQMNSKVFYVYNTVSGDLFISKNGGVSFSQAGSAGAGGSKVIRAVPGKEGDLWVALYGGGLTRSKNSGETFTKIAGVITCGAVGFGKAAEGKSFPSIYIWGTVNGVLGIHRSSDEGLSWTRINDDAHEYGGPANGMFVVGDMNVFGRVYMSTAGRGIVYGESDQTCVPYNVISKIQVDSQPVLQSSFTTAPEGSTVKLMAEAPSNGIFSWNGPNDFSSNEQYITLSNIKDSGFGIYTLHYTDSLGCQSSAQTFTILQPVQLVESITVDGENGITSISEKGGTLQMTIKISPPNATDQTVAWSIEENSALATISSSGLVTAVKDGTVTVRATANDGSGVFGETEITINNQTITASEESVNSSYEIFPNPTGDFLIIKNARSVKKIILKDINGRVLKEEFTNQYPFRISLNDLSAGVYVMELKDIRNQSHIKRIVKY